MSLLTNEQIDDIANKLEQDNICNESLFNDLLDHICCSVEADMEKGISYDSAVQLAFTNTCPNGAGEIEEELFFLLTIKKQINMKRVIYGMGFASSFTISMGLLFRQMHWPYASMLVLFGFSFLLITLFILYASSIKRIKAYTTSYKVRMISGFIAGFLISLGSMFKSLHWPGANIQFLLGMAILNLVFLPLFFYQLYKQSLVKL